MGDDQLSIGFPIINLHFNTLSNKKNLDLPESSDKFSLDSFYN